MNDKEMIPLSDLRRLTEEATPAPWQEWIYRDSFPTEVRTAGSAPINYGLTPRHTSGPDGSFVPFGHGPAYTRSHVCTMTTPTSTGHGLDTVGLSAAKYAVNADARLIVALRNSASALIEAAENRDELAKDLEKVQSEATALEIERDELRKLFAELTKRAEHDEGCARYRFVHGAAPGRPCTCGLTSLLARGKATASDMQVTPLSDLRRLMESATPAPWAVGFVVDGSGQATEREGAWITANYPGAEREALYPTVVTGGDSSGCRCGVDREADAALIVALRNSAAALIEAAEERDRIVKYLASAPHGDCHDGQIINDDDQGHVERASCDCYIADIRSLLAGGKS